MLRTHDVVLADGTFRVVLTPKRRVIAILDAPTTMLGPLHVAVEVDRSGFAWPREPRIERTHETAGFFDDIGHAVDDLGKKAEHVFNDTSKVVTSVARPAFDVLKKAAGEGAHVIAHVTPFLPASTRREFDHAANVIMRAKLGDLTAKQFMKTIATAANAGVKSAQQVADSLIDVSKVVAKVAEVPLSIQMPAMAALGPLSPLQQYQKLISAVQKGDFHALEKVLKDDVSFVQGVVSMVPGVGTGISSALGAGIAALEGGHPLEFAVRTAYGALPIPSSVRQVTDVVLDTVLAFAAHPHDLTDVAVQVARDRVPAGLPREVFDTLVQIVVKRVPIQKAGASMVDHYVQQYAPAIGGQHIDDLLRHLDASAVARAEPRDALGRFIQPLAALHG
jgi:hypothetical protein